MRTEKRISQKNMEGNKEVPEIEVSDSNSLGNLLIKFHFLYIET